MIWTKFLIFPLLSILPRLSLASPAVFHTTDSASHIGFLHPSDLTLTRRQVIDSSNEIPSTCSSACPNSLLNKVTSCSTTAQEKLKACLCGKGSAFLDQWSTCDACLVMAFSANGQTYTSWKPDCTGVKSSGEQSFATSVAVANSNRG